MTGEAPVSQMNVSIRLRRFSGTTSCRSHEVDFDIWGNSVELILQASMPSQGVRVETVLEKCQFFQTSVRYLGHIVSQHGVEKDPDKVETVKSWPNPTRAMLVFGVFMGISGDSFRIFQR